MTLKLVASGKFAEVHMTTSLHKQFVGLSTSGKIEAKRRLEKVMQFYANDGPKYLSDAKFKSNEGRHALGPGFNRDVLIQAFADVPAGIRIYGCRETIGGKSWFICTAIDDNKKKQKADQAKLAKAATVVGAELKLKGVVQ